MTEHMAEATLRIAAVPVADAGEVATLTAARALSHIRARTPGKCVGLESTCWTTMATIAAIATTSTETHQRLSVSGDACGRKRTTV